MKWRISTALGELMPTSSYGITDEDYSSIQWMDSSNPLPSIDAINAKITELDNAEPMRLLRIERTNRLKECDWTQCPDVPDATKTKYQAYRQQLRDITKTYKSLKEVVWPEEPI